MVYHLDQFQKVSIKSRVKFVTKFSRRSSSISSFYLGAQINHSMRWQTRLWRSLRRVYFTRSLRDAVSGESLVTIVWASGFFRITGNGGERSAQAVENTWRATWSLPETSMPSIPTVSTANDADNRYSDREPRFPSSKVRFPSKLLTFCFNNRFRKEPSKWHDDTS